MPSTPPCGGRLGAPGGRALPLREAYLLVPLPKSRLITEFWALRAGDTGDAVGVVGESDQVFAAATLLAVVFGGFTA